MIAGLLVIIGVILAVLGVVAIEAAVCMMLWNWVIVALFAVNPIGYWLAFGIVLFVNYFAGFFHRN